MVTTCDGSGYCRRRKAHVPGANSANSAVCFWHECPSRAAVCSGLMEYPRQRELLDIGREVRSS
jgi:hypothetical protein